MWCCRLSARWFTPDQCTHRAEMMRVFEPESHRRCRAGRRKVSLAGCSRSSVRMCRARGGEVAGAGGPRLISRSCLGACRIDSAASVRIYKFRYRSAAHFLEVFRDYYGPTHKPFAALDANGKQALEAISPRCSSNSMSAVPHRFVVPSEYLEVLSRNAEATVNSNLRPLLLRVLADGMREGLLLSTYPTRLKPAADEVNSSWSFRPRVCRSMNAARRKKQARASSGPSWHPRPSSSMRAARTIGRHGRGRIGSQLRQPHRRNAEATGRCTSQRRNSLLLLTAKSNGQWARSQRDEHSACHTVGGNRTATSCGRDSAGATERISYTADYYFYIIDSTHSTRKSPWNTRHDSASPLHFSHRIWRELPTSLREWNIKSRRNRHRSKLGTPPAIRAMAIVQDGRLRRRERCVARPSVDAAVAAATVSL